MAGKRKGLPGLAETWILQAIPRVTSGKPPRLPAPRFPPDCPGDEGAGVAPDFPRSPQLCYSVTHRPAVSKSPAGLPQRAGDWPETAGRLWEAFRSPGWSFGSSFPPRDLSVHTCPTEPGGQAGQREGPRRLRFASAQEGCPPGATAEVREPRRLGPALQAGGCLTRSIRGVPEEGGDWPPVTACRRADSPFRLRLGLRCGSNSCLSAAHPCPASARRPRHPASLPRSRFRTSSRDPGGPAQALVTSSRGP